MWLHPQRGLFIRNYSSCNVIFSQSNYILMQVVVVLVSFSNMLQKKLFLEEEEGVVSVHNYSTVLKRFFFVTFFLSLFG